MSQATEQEIVEPVVEGGNKIQTLALPIQNYNLAQPVQLAADLIKGCLESDSANSRAQISNNDAKMMERGWAMVLKEIALAVQFKDLVKGRHERQHFLTVPHDNEVKACSNIPVRRFCEALLNFVYVGIGTDESTMQHWVSMDGEADIKASADHVTTILNTYILPGEGRLTAPVYPTGVLLPSSNLGAAYVREPGTSVPPAGLKDVPDGASVAPAPGSTQQRIQR